MFGHFRSDPAQSSADSDAKPAVNDTKRGVLEWITTARRLRTRAPGPCEALTQTGEAVGVARFPERRPSIDDVLVQPRAKRERTSVASLLRRGAAGGCRRVVDRAGAEVDVAERDTDVWHDE